MRSYCVYAFLSRTLSLPSSLSLPFDFCIWFSLLLDLVFFRIDTWRILCCSFFRSIFSFLLHCKRLQRQKVYIAICVSHAHILLNDFELDGFKRWTSEYKHKPFAREWVINKSYMFHYFFFLLCYCETFSSASRRCCYKRPTLDNSADAFSQCTFSVWYLHLALSIEFQMEFHYHGWGDVKGKKKHVNSTHRVLH